MNKSLFTYKKSGVDINSADRFVNFIAKNSSKKKINIKKNIFLKNELIRPTKIYVSEIMNLINKKLINGCANITGGGIAENLKRIIPENLCANIDLSKIKPLKIFDWLKKMCNKYESTLYLVAHNNIGFDMIFLKRLLSDQPEFIKNNIRFVDSMYLAKYLMPKMRSVSMKTLTKVFGIESGNHRALGDTIALKKVYHELIKKLPLASRNVEKIYNILNII